MVHPVLLLLASGAARAGDLSHRLVNFVAFSDRGDCRGRRSFVFEGAFFPSRANVARAADDLTRLSLLAPK